MPIKSINMKSVASYSEEGTIFTNLKKLNFFVGNNGTGKSTIVRCLRNYTLPNEQKDARYNYCEIQGYSEEKEKLLIYDEQFKQENFINVSEIDGVFSLNHKNKEIDDLIKLREDNLRDLERKYLLLEEREKKNEDQIRKKEKKLIEEIFDKRLLFKSFPKVSFEYGGNKNNNFLYIKSLCNNNLTEIPLLDLTNEYNELYEKDISSINQTLDKQNYYSLEQYINEINLLLKKIIVGKESINVSGLIKSLDNSIWVHEGIKYLDKSGNRCPFCQQPLMNKEELTNDLNSYFDKTYEEDITMIKSLQRSIESKLSELKGTADALRDFSELYKDCSELSDLCREYSDEIQTIIQQKLLAPNTIVEIHSQADILNKIQTINAKISHINSKASNIDDIRKKWKEKCWQHIAYEMNDKIKQYKKRKEYFERQLIPLYKSHKELINSGRDFNRQIIQKLRLHTINTKEAVDNINVILRNTGFTSFKITEIPTVSANKRYRIIRNEDDSHTNIYTTLSEGEKTLISFLYFYQLCLGTNDLSSSEKKKIIVIDDPISSLDSHSLFLISSICQKLIMHDNENPSNFKDKSINQVLIFTHNLYFYKEISFTRRPICKDRWHYQIYKDKNGNSAQINKKDQFHSDDYHIMWETLKENKDKTGVDTKINVMISNTMRRIIDSYVEFIGLNKDGKNPTWKSIQSLEPDDPRYIIACSFISEINNESHAVSPLDTDYYSRVINQDTSSLFNAFKLIFDEIGKNHYAMMMDEEG